MTIFVFLFLDSPTLLKYAESIEAMNTLIRSSSIVLDWWKRKLSYCTQKSTTLGWFYARNGELNPAISFFPQGRSWTWQLSCYFKKRVDWVREMNTGLFILLQLKLSLSTKNKSIASLSLFTWTHIQLIYLELLN